MSFTVAFGLLGTAVQWYLPGTDPTLLPEPPPGAPSPLPTAIESVVAGPVAKGLIHDGLVRATGAPSGAEGLVLDVTGAWNSVKNANFLSDTAARLTLSGFVHTDVTLGDGGDSVVQLVGAKRGNVVTGSGDDMVLVDAATNLYAWVSEFRIATGRGDDTVVVRPLDTDAAAAAGDVTFAATANGAGAFAATDAAIRVVASLGGGDDQFFGQGLSRDRVNGGSGDDVLQAGGGEDTLAGGTGDDLFVFAAGHGDDVVLDFTVGADRLVFADMDDAAVEALLATAVQEGGDTLLTTGGGDGSIRLVGVAEADLSLSDLL